MQQKFALQVVINLVNLRVINNLNSSLVRVNIPTTKGKANKKTEVLAMTRLFDSLVSNFGFEVITAGIGSVSRTWTKEVEVAWHGKQTVTYKVCVHHWGSDSVRVNFMQDGRLVKEKIYSSGSARTLNAIRETVKYAGFEF